jgi:hypothetical protein
LDFAAVASIAVRHDARRVYFERRWSTNSARLNLAVLAFDAQGTPLGEP